VRVDVQHAFDALNAAMDKIRYGDSPESDLLEAHATLDSLIARLLDAAPSSLGAVSEAWWDEWRVAAERSAGAAPLDVEALAQAFHEERVGCDTEVCDPTPAFYRGVSRTMHETDARGVATEYARLLDAAPSPAAEAGESPFQRVVDDLSGGCGCACHGGIGYNAACGHCVPRASGNAR